MLLRTIAKRLAARPTNSCRRKRRAFFQPHLEPLEQRRVLAVVTPFTPRFEANATGDIAFVANTNLRADPSNPNAANAQNGVGSQLNNNNFTMVNLDVDDDPTTFNSSRADLNLPAGATVLFAGLYWGAQSNSALRNQVLFEAPGGGGYVSITGSVIGSDGSAGDYEAFADVTSLVQAASNGTYTVANVRANVNATNKYAGWSLVIAYRDPSAPPRNLTVFDGYAVIRNTAADRNVTIDVSGFQAPPTGPVNAKIGIIAYEGDRGSVGDSATFRSGGNPQVLSDAQNPANNFFNSSISNLGKRVTSKDPDFVNQLGFDADIVEANGVIPNGATSASIDLTTTGDAYYPGVVTTVIDLFAPQIDTAKAVTDVNGGDVEPGDILEYTVTVTNVGGDAATDVILRDLIPANSTYVAGSLEIVAGANAGPKTDAPGDDQANFDAGGNFVQFGLGTGANGAAGGTLAIGASTTITFQVMVNAGVADGAQITNQANVNFTGETTGFNLTGSSNPVTVIASNRADLAVTKTIDNPNPTVGGTSTFTITLTNNGPQNATGVQLTDLLPPSLTFVGATPSQGTYDPVSGVWGVGNLADGATATLIIQAIVDTPDAFTNRAQVTNSDQFDPNPNNNFDAVVTPPEVADLAVTKNVDDDTPNVGDTVTFTVTLTNNGPDDATTVALTDLLPSGLEFVSATPSQGTYDAAAGVWTVGTVANGAALTLTIQAVVISAGSSTNTATISTVDQFDLVIGNNSDDADVTPQQADLALEKTVDNPAPNVGDLLTYTVTLTNNGPNDATGVTVLDILHPGVTFVSASPSQGTFNPQTGVWTVGTVANGMVVTLQLTVEANAVGSVGNLAEVAGADQFDPDPTNNDTSIVIPVLAPAAVSGTVYVDRNNNGRRDSGELPIPGVTVRLVGTTNTGASVSEQVATDADGRFSFVNVSPGTYQLREVHPTSFIDGRDRAGSLGGVVTNDRISNIVVGLSQQGVDYLFGERGLTPDAISKRNLIASRTGSLPPLGEAGPGVIFLAAPTVDRTDNDAGENPLEVSNSKNVKLADVGKSRSTITINSSFTIADIDVWVDISHTYVGQLRLTLWAPDNSIGVTLVHRRGGGGDHYSFTTFDDSALTSINGAKAPFAGRFQPRDQLSLFNGINAKGTWKLLINDNEAGRSGVLKGWGLVVRGETSAPAPPVASTDGLSGLTNTRSTSPSPNYSVVDASYLPDPQPSSFTAPLPSGTLDYFSSAEAARIRDELYAGGVSATERDEVVDLLAPLTLEAIAA